MGVFLGKSKLHKAIRRGDNKRLLELLELGVSPEARLWNSSYEVYEEYPLQRAVKANNLKAVEILLEKGAGHHPYDYCGGSFFDSWSLFSYALFYNYTAIADVLIQAKPDYLNMQDGLGYTPLARMAEHGNIEGVKYLLEKGADTTIKNNDNRTPYFVAQKEGRQDVIDLLAPYYVSPVEKAPVVTKEGEGWKKLADDRIASVTIEEGINYKITEIFNFTARERTKICVNMASGYESVESTGFDSMQDKTLLEIALKELHKQGGTADSGSITGMYKTPRLQG